MVHYYSVAAAATTHVGGTPRNCSQTLLSARREARYGTCVCGRYAAAAAQDTLVEEFRIDAVVGPLPAPSYNIAPTDQVPAIWTRPVAGSSPATYQRQLTALRWGLVPSWAKAPDHGARLINARLETVGEKPSFRRAVAVRRCLLPAIGYYEWYPVTDSRTGKARKQPVFLRPADGRLLVMAGLYEFWKDRTAQETDQEWVRTCTIITTRASDSIGRIHERMPVTIGGDDWDAWLSPDVDAREALALVNASPITELDAYDVAPLVNRVGTDGAELIEPLRGE